MAESLTIPVNLDSSKFNTLMDQYTGDVFAMIPGDTATCSKSYQMFICECVVSINSYNIGVFNTTIYFTSMPNSIKIIAISKGTSSSVYCLKLTHSDNSLALITTNDANLTTHVSNVYGYITGSIICIGII